MRRHLAGGLIVVLGLFPMLAGAATAIRLHVGSIKNIRFGTVTQVVVGNDAILGASVLDSGEVLLIPKAPGTSDLMVWTEGQREFRYQVQVDGQPISDRLVLANLIMAQFPEVKIAESGGKLVFTGYVTERDKDRFNAAAGALDGAVSLVKVDPDTQKDMVEMDVSILEINKSYQKTLGISWNDTLPGPSFGMVWNVHANGKYGVLPDVEDSDVDYEGMLNAVGVNSSSPSGYLGWITSLGSEIQLLQENGAARSLAEPRLSTVSGETASFLAGGEIPVAILNEYGQPVVEFREYGIQLDISPVTDRNQMISSRVRAEVSSIDYSTQVNGVPGLLRRMTESTINAHSGDTIVISGLVNTQDAKSINKVPLLGDIPVLGELFKSRDFQQARSELLIFVTPRITKPNEPMDPSITKNLDDLHKVLGGSSNIDDVLAE